MWGNVPNYFVLAFDPEKAKRLIDADKQLPPYVRRIAREDGFITTTWDEFSQRGGAGYEWLGREVQASYDGSV